MHKSELNKDLVDQDVYLLWPDNGTWYQATVTKVRGAPHNLPACTRARGTLFSLSTIMSWVPSTAWCAPDALSAVT